MWFNFIGGVLPHCTNFTQATQLGNDVKLWVSKQVDGSQCVSGGSLSP
jgi:hypothetical protein